MLHTFAVPAGRNSERGLGPDQAVDDIPDRSIPANRENGILFLCGSLPCQFDGVRTTLGRCHIHLPVRGRQFLCQQIG